ncbi:MAG: 23S rRNA (guanosine(2251)-2'-O)-methyltransferase RlmB [Flavobacteriales bacterium]|nr:23S rRNA (guanosine(2251)-2'-O)-methyltransferase RlmB [Flavobacteriales bacterium]
MNQEEIIIGIYPILEGIDSGKEFQRVFIQKDLVGDRIKQLIMELKRHQIPFQKVPKEKLYRISRKNHQGVIGFISPISYYQAEHLIPEIYEAGIPPALLFLDGVTDVRNFGAIARSAECFGFHAIIVPEKGMAPINAEAVKSSSGALLRIPIIRTKHIRSTLNFLKESGIHLIGCSEKSPKPIHELDVLQEPCCLLLGNEHEGLAPETIQILDSIAQIPMVGQTQSLNVGASAAIVMYEVLKQRIMN